ncbi:hypothetical protein Tco_0928637 [Tanacetum coccineum]
MRILEITRCGMLRDVESRRDLKKFLAASTFPDKCVKPAEAIGAKLGHLIVAANVNSHDDILNLSTVASIGCTVLTRGMRLYAVIISLLQNEATVDLFAAEIQIHKQPLNAADYILIGIEMSVVKVFKTSSLQDC